AEQAALKAAIGEAEDQLASFDEDTDRVAQFLALAEKYTDFSELTTPMINEFVDRIVVHTPEKVDGERTQEVEIFLKFVGDCEFPTPEPTPEEIVEQERLKKERARSRERYQRDKRGEVVHGTSFDKICQFCGKPFTAGNYHAKYCCPSCRQKDYRRQKERKPAPEKTCPVCGRSFTPSRPYMLYCSESCRHEANNRRAAEIRKGARDDAAGQ
ncbi:MAG: DUF4368 domain-containing protein, partial [Clostridia bacterium]|nr:DUF4368 domain-containing protein [Clostridia bacterium]